MAELKSIDLGNNSISLEGASALAELLRAKNALRDINIYMNDIGDDGAFQVGIFLQYLRFQSWLQSTFCMTYMQLASALNSNKHVSALDVGGNNIGPGGAKALAAALRGNDSLRTLEMGYNPIGPEGTKALADIFKYDIKVSQLASSLGVRHWSSGLITRGFCCSWRP